MILSTGYYIGKIWHKTSPEWLHIPRRFRKSIIGLHRQSAVYRGTNQPEDAMFYWRARHLIAVTAITITGISVAASAQTYPERPVKLVTQGAAGSGPDVIARIVTD